MCLVYQTSPSAILYTLMMGGNSNKSEPKVEQADTTVDQNTGCILPGLKDVLYLLDTFVVPFDDYVHSSMHVSMAVYRTWSTGKDVLAGNA